MTSISVARTCDHVTIDAVRDEYILVVIRDYRKGKGKGKSRDIALPGGSPPQSYGTSLAIWDHSVTFHPTHVNSPRLTPAMQAGTRFTYPGGMEG